MYSTVNGPKLAEHTVSSYTPSLSILAEAYRKAAKQRPLPRTILAISQPETPSHSRLPGTIAEVNELQRCTQGHAFKWLDRDKGTIMAVLEAMKTHSWCHFACHGIQHPTSPTQSSFALHDGPLTLQRMMSQHFPSAELAFLSACQTASGDGNLPEEAVHLAAGMLAAGYITVIATMWSIGDEDAPVVAKEVYTYLTNPKHDDGRDERLRGAYAVHHAVRILRDKVGEKNFVKWVPFVHFGV